MYDLKALQEKELEILQTVQDQCERREIEYAVIHGNMKWWARSHGVLRGEGGRCL